MYADVVVLTYQAPDINYFTYKIPTSLEKQIKIGQLVEVPFGKRNPQGIVISLKDKVRPLSTGSDLVTSAKIKEIFKTVLERPFLLPYQIDLFKWMSAYYFAPMVNCLETIMPKIPKSLKGGAFHKVGPLSTGSDLVAKQTIILVPTINRIPQILAEYSQAKNYVVFHNELKPKEKFEIWTKILSGKVDFIFGSRNAIFTPCPNLKQIIIYDEHDGAYKDERSPYFDTLTVAEKIIELTGAKLKIIDSTPKITTFANHQKILEIPARKTSTKIISMEEERLAGNKTMISDYLLEKIKKSQNTLLFVNKKKESGHVYCKNCGENNFVETEPEICPSCLSPDIHFSSLNIYSLEKLISKLIPNAKINIIADKFKTENIKTSQIDIATSLILYLPFVQKYDAVAFVLADTILNVADFDTNEKLYETISNLKRLCTTNGKLIIQTFNQENFAIQNATSGNYQHFYLEEIKLRKLLSYPPFGFLIKLTKSDKNAQKLKNIAEKTVNDLRFTINDLRLTAEGPYSPIFQRQKKPTYNIILKYKLENYSLKSRQNAIKSVYPILKNLKGWQITVEPESIN